ncbi:hypothetical protein RIN61_20180 [Pseudomonas inefficax]|uniref:hypothetical protein n=1 Tax=Pseudomonas inefficax TaxID=2078786 RepID=UPI0028BD2DF2|nr:hypothetical protein [Pseudomonas inefficax]WNN38497.1 hypothetical protein RIN61_20180 [Pseudomonas inefficax]
MSLETEIAALTSTGKALIDTINGKKAGIDAALAAAVAAAPAIGRTFYVDQELGVDTAAGTVDAPLKTINQALANTPSGGTVEIVFVKDYVLDSVISASNRGIVIRGDTVGGNVRKLTLRDFPTGTGTKRMGGFQVGRRVSITFADLTLALPDTAGLTLPLDNFYALLYAGGNTIPPFLPFNLYNVAFTLAGTFAGKLVGPGINSLAFVVIASTIPTALEGSLITGVAAGKDPNTVPWLITNVTKL